MHKTPMDISPTQHNSKPTTRVTHWDMCRSDNQQFGSHRPDPRLLTTTAFYLKLKLSTSSFHDNALTLVCLPRINGFPLEVNESTIRPESPAYITLYRLVNAGVDGASAVFGSTERIRVGEGASFEVYIGEEKLLKGIFRKGKSGEEWRVECTCLLEREVAGIEEAEVCVAVEGGKMRESVVVPERRRRRRRRHRGCLEEIPEEEEEEEGVWDDGESSSSSSCESGSEDDDRTTVEEMEMEMEYEMEGVRWAVDVGIWVVVCLGVGYLVSRASTKTLRRRNFLV